MIEHNGKNYETVTTVLQFCSGYGHIPPDILQIAADRGSRVHANIASRIKGLGSWGAEADLKGYLTSFEYVESQLGQVYALEHRYFNDEFSLTGQVDLIADFDGRKTLIDWKTSLKPNLLIWLLQAAAYAKLAEYEGDALFIQLGKNGGNPKLHLFDYKRLKEGWQQFLMCYEVHKMFFANQERIEISSLI